ncbi:MAG: hypothetical protein HDT16_01925 [Oscillibacter sp.]|nr:hypothetical protein [Oscillibacter sp.]
MEHRVKPLKMLSILLLLCGLLIPMYNIFPNGLIPNRDSWFFTETFHVLMEKGTGAFQYIGVVFHLAVWLPGMILCIGAFTQHKRVVRISSMTGAALLLAGLFLAALLTGEMRLVHPVNGYICIGYWIDLILFAVCIWTAFRKEQTGGAP